MNEGSRTKKSIKNSIYATTSQLIIIVFNFIVRTVFIKVLSSEYLGINSLFTNIITMLSLTDLGIGIAMPYTLYLPLANNNKEKIKSLMKLYSKIYNTIGIAVFLIGISLIPFLKYIIKNIPNVSNFYYIYILFIINASSSYFFIYKKNLMDSDQKSYISNNIITIMTFVKTIFEILVLTVSKNYILYLWIGILVNVVQNFIISYKCNKIYPYIKEKVDNKEKKESIREITKNTSALMIYKVAIVALTGTDSIIISKFLGVVMVGIYSNYLLIVNSIIKVTSKIFDAITSSIGNLVVTSSTDKSKDIFYKLQFFSFWLYAYFSICIITLINPFIKLWVGDQYLLSNLTAIIIGINLYVYGMQSVVTSYRNAYGLFQQGKYRPIIMTIVNIVLSVILVQKFEILGVILATVFSRLFVTGIYDPIVVFKYGFKDKYGKYFGLYIMYFLIFITMSTVFNVISLNFVIDSYLKWILYAIILSLLINIIFILIFFKNDNFIFYKNKLKWRFNKSRLR